MNLFYNNIDFPGNNIVMWRPRTEEGRWRWIAKDTDFGLGLYGRNANYNTIEWIYNHNYDSSNNWANTSQATQLFRSLMADADFKRDIVVTYRRIKQDNSHLEKFYKFIVGQLSKKMGPGKTE